MLLSTLLTLLAGCELGSPPNLTNPPPVFFCPEEPPKFGSGTFEFPGILGPTTRGLKIVFSYIQQLLDVTVQKCGFKSFP